MATRKIHPPVQSGDRFGRLVVISESEPRVYASGKVRRWLCQCECGRQTVADQGHLKAGATKSCGCESPTFIDRTNQIYGRLKVIALSGCDGSGKTKWLCQCECGKTSVVDAAKLANGETRSCGCLSKQLTSERFTTHGASMGGPSNREYRIWRSMLIRCTYPTATGYASYGGRGIKVCAEWTADFISFLRDMGPCPSSNHSIDRIDGNGDYCPGNCRWATRRVQNGNRRVAVMVNYGGEQVYLSEAARQAGIQRTTVQARQRAGWPKENWFLPVGTKPTGFS